MPFTQMINIKHIILGTWYNVFNKKQDVSNPRLDICSCCPDKKYLLGIGYICKHCGCVLKSKTTINDEKCPINKW